MFDNPNVSMIFRCPQCEGSYYGSSVSHDAMVGNCHSFGCSFSWKRTDDYKYFLRVVKQEYPGFRPDDIATLATLI